MFRILKNQMPCARWLCATVICSMLTSCGGGGASNETSVEKSVDAISTTGPGDTGNRFPLNEGDRWVYEVNDGANSGEETVLAGGSRMVNGKSAIEVHTTPPTGAGSTDYYVKSAGSLALVGDDSGDANASLFYPIRLLTLPLSAGDTFVQLDKKGLDFGTDVDGDGKNEHFDIHSEVQVVDEETVSTPAGDFHAMKVQTIAKETIVLSFNGERHIDTVTMTEWYQSGVGIVKRTIVDDFEGNASSSEHILKAYQVGGSRSENIAPTVVSSYPGAITTQVQWVQILAAFSEPMTRDTVNSDSFLVLDSSSQRVSGSVQFDPYTKSARFYPSIPLATGQYTGQITAAARDLAGNPLVPYSWSFTIEGGPMVVSTAPAPNAIAASKQPAISIDFSKPLDPPFVNEAAVSVYDKSGYRLSATVTLDGTSRVLVTLSDPLPSGMMVRLTVNASQLRDLQGNSMAANYDWSFSAPP